MNKKTNTIELIHKDFSTAQDRLLTEAKQILDKTVISPETVLEHKSDRLKNLGFINSQDVKLAQELKQKRSITINSKKEKEDLTKRIFDYKVRYPNQKFLTIDELNRICEKWGLTYAPAKTYTRTIPEKNLKEIDSAPELYKHKEGIIARGRKISFEYHYDDRPMFYRLEGVRFAWHYLWLRRTWFSLLNRKQIKTAASMITENKYKIEGDLKYGRGSLRAERLKTDQLFIAAPKSHFNKEGRQFRNKRVRHLKIEDPIVFRFIKGGVQILSMWGDEKFDPNLEPAVQNETLN